MSMILVVGPDELLLFNSESGSIYTTGSYNCIDKSFRFLMKSLAAFSKRM